MHEKSFRQQISIKTEYKTRKDQIIKSFMGESGYTMATASGGSAEPRRHEQPKPMFIKEEMESYFVAG